METVLRHLYMAGPSTLGMWENMHPNDVCARISGVPSDHWAAAPEACDELIDRRVHAWSLVVGAAATVYVVHYVVYHVMQLTLLYMANACAYGVSQSRNTVPCIAHHGTVTHVGKCAIQTPHIHGTAYQNVD